MMTPAILLVLGTALTPEMEFAANAWPIVVDARHRTCRIEAAKSVAKSAPSSNTWRVRNVLGRLQLAVAFCALFDKNDLKTRDAWVRKARRTFGSDRPSDLHPGFGLLLEGATRGSSFQRKLLRELGIEKGEDRWISNLPLSPGRLPGESFLVSSPPYLVERGTRSAAFVTQGPPTEISVPLDASRLRGLRLGSHLTRLLEPHAERGRLRADDIRLLTMPVPVVKQWVESHESIQERIERKQEPMVVTRAWEASIAYELRRGHLSGPAWAGLVSSVRSVVAHRKTTLALDVQSSRYRQESRMQLRLQDRQVLLYEAMLGSYILHHLGGEDVDAELESVSPDLLLAKPDVAQEPEDGPRWDLVTISSGIYPKGARLDQPWNRDSARLVQEALQPFRPRAVHELHANRDAPLTKKALDTFVGKLRPRTKGADLVVVYIISHGVTYGDSDLMLQLADFEKRRDGENMRETKKGLLPVGDLYRRLRFLGRPFVLLVDSCLPQSQIADYRSSLGFILDEGGLSLDYSGSKALITDELASLGERMRAWGSGRPYLGTENLVVLGAKPGVYTPARSHPIDPFGPPVGPLADRLWSTSAAARHRVEDNGLTRAITLAIDSKGGIGEITTRGTISWSDLAGFRKALWPRPAQPVAKRLLRVKGLQSVTTAGPSETLILTWMDGDGWSLGYWRPGQPKPVLLRSGLHGPTVASTLKAIYVHDASESAWSRHPIEDGVPATNREPVSGATHIGAVSGDWGELMVMGSNGDVDSTDPLWVLKEAGFTSVGLGPGEDVTDLTQWPPPEPIIAMDDRTELVRLVKKSRERAGDCGTRLGYLSTGPMALYGLAADGRHICRFDFDWNSQKRPVPPLFGEPVDLTLLRGFEVRGEGFVVGIGDDVWSLPGSAFEWND